MSKRALGYQLATTGINNRQKLRSCEKRTFFISMGLMHKQQTASAVTEDQFQEIAFTIVTQSNGHSLVYNGMCCPVLIN